MLAVALAEGVYVYKYDGTNFNKEQKISPSALGNTRVSWTEDHEYLTFKNGDLAFVYKSSGGSYQPIENNGEFNKDFGK